MDLDLTGRIALVTGGSKGIGAAITRQLAREGVRVGIAARPSDELERLATEVTEAKGVCAVLPVDVRNADAIGQCVEKLGSTWGGIDILVNNVGGALRFGGFEELSDDDWMQAFDFNVMSVVRFTRAALPYLRKSTLRRIINISSTSALQPGAYNPHYCATKAAVVNLGKHLANILAKEAILVNTVCAGPVHSQSWDANVARIAALRNLSHTDAAAAVDKEEAAKIPLGIVGEGRHIADAVALLASPRSAWTTGSCIHINGGKMAAAL
jgi:3-oxoacyl-[acyl-carrier protein] reductase